MAKVMLGPVVGMISGSVGGGTWSHNRYGTYLRRRATPTKSYTDEAMMAKGRMTTATQAWQGISVALQKAWNGYAAANPVAGSLGQAQALTGHVAYVGSHIRSGMAALGPLTDPPILPAPEGLNYLVVAPDKTGTSCEVTFGTSPLGIADRLWILGCYVESLGVTYVQNHLRFIGVSPVEQATPYELYTAIELRLGDLVIGSRVVLNVAVFSNTSRQLSSPLRCEGTVV